MRKTRILFVGELGDFRVSEDEEIEVPKKKGLSINGKYVSDDLIIYRPSSLLDYDVLLVDTLSLDMRGAMALLLECASDLLDFFNGGGIAVVFSDRQETHPSYFEWSGDKVYSKLQTYDWLLSLFNVTNKAGKSVRFSSDNRIGRILRDDDFGWKCIFETDKPHEVLATNPSKKTVGLDMKVSDGRLILIPAYRDHSRRNNIARAVLDVIKKDYLGKERIRISKPKWIAQYQLPGEAEAARTFEKAKETMAGFESAKGVLYLFDKELTEAIRILLDDMGYEARNLEIEGKYDIEIRLGEARGLLEAKGLTKHANATHLRQLMDHYVLEREVADEKNQGADIKGIFVVNHFREEHPDGRGEPFTREARRIGERFEFCLMTTVQLHHTYCDWKSGKTNLAKIHSRIWEAKGVLEN